MRPTKMKRKYEPLFRRYGTTLRRANSKVWHPVYKEETECTPLEFALYETAIKAIDAHYQALISRKYVPQSVPNATRVVMTVEGPLLPTDESSWLASYQSARRNHQAIAERDGFDLLVSLPMSLDETIADYRYCCRELGELYAPLLD